MQLILEHHGKGFINAVSTITLRLDAESPQAVRDALSLAVQGAMAREQGSFLFCGKRLALADFIVEYSATKWGYLLRQWEVAGAAIPSTFVVQGRRYGLAPVRLLPLAEWFARDCRRLEPAVVYAFG